jgi:DNA primase catalytic core
VKNFSFVCNREFSVLPNFIAFPLNKKHINSMDIKEIKDHLKINQVLAHYNMKADKNNRICCPFHNDKTPSMQVYPDTGTVFCFSSNCKLHGKALDGIDFIMYKENISKHAALLKAKQIVTQGVFTSTQPKAATKTPPPNREAFLEKMFSYFCHGVGSSTAAKEYLQKRGLDYKLLASIGSPVGYNTAQWHHGTRKDENLIQQAIACGLMYEYGTNNRTGGVSYGCFGKYGICFALRNKENQVTGMYFRSTLNEDKMKHYYLKDRTGLYPHYPNAATKKLILTESIIDAATLLQIPEINGHYGLLAAYGTNGLTPEHREAIKNLSQLSEIVFAFDNDDAGNEAVNKYSKELLELLPQIKITRLSLPKDEDINGFFVGHNAEALQYIINERKFIFSFSDENKINQAEIPNEKPQSVTVTAQTINGKLNTIDPEQIHYNTPELLITLLGGININTLDRLRTTLYIRRNPHVNPQYSIRQNIDLYQDDLVEKLARRAAEKLDVSSSVIAETLAKLTEELESFRITQVEAKKKEKPQKKQLTPYEIDEAIKILSHKDLYTFTKKAYAKSGIIGELNNAMILHFAMNSRRSDDPVSVICLSASGTGKSYLLERVAKCFPREEIIENTQLTENSFYYFKQDEIKHKVFLIEDMDGAGSVEYPIRELISKKRISKTVTLKDTKGNLRTITLTVEGPVSFCAATTKEKLYEDNANRCILIYLDNSTEQDQKIMQYHKELKAGLVNRAEEEKIQTKLSNLQRVLKNYRIINPYATLIDLPQEVFKPRRTLSLLLSFIESVTNFHQYQCEKQDGALLTHPTHIQIAFDLLKESLFTKSDELSSTVRSFLNDIIAYTEKSKKKNFYMQEIRLYKKMHPRTTQRHLYELLQFGYIKISGGNKYRKGYEYEVTELAKMDLKTNIDKHIETVMQTIWQKYNENKESKPVRNSTPNGQVSHLTTTSIALSA